MHSEWSDIYPPVKHMQLVFGAGMRSTANPSRRGGGRVDGLPVRVKILPLFRSAVVRSVGETMARLKGPDVAQGVGASNVAGDWQRKARDRVRPFCRRLLYAG